ncbi:hypothetical protein B1H10_08570 [candidate division KSB1 bacterium 4484_188]|nr:MAG: hypothetical protein B1H10_08570 [candidate division KSB1 bacterium 4484_188]
MFHAGTNVGGFLRAKICFPGKSLDLYGRKGLIIGGIIWGIWHCPMVLMGLNYPRNPIIGLFLMLIFTVSVGIIFYYFYRRTGSVFAPALAHGVINWTGKTIMMLFINEDKINMLIDGPTGIPALFLLSFIAFILYLRIDWSAKKLTK